jgi:RNA polymerase sigma-70 factor (family 1)
LYDLDDAHDIIHDVFVKLWQERKQLQITSNLKTFLFSITRYSIVDKIRKNITREKYAEMVQALGVTYEAGIEQVMAAKEIQQNINKSLVELSPRIREIYRLSREEQLSIAEIAAKLQISEQTVKNQLTSALKHLKQSLLSLSTTACILWLLS